MRTLRGMSDGSGGSRWRRAARWMAVGFRDRTWLGVPLVSAAVVIANGWPATADQWWSLGIMFAVNAAFAIGWYGGRIAEAIHRGPRGVDRARPVDDDERRAMFEVWREESTCAEQLYRNAVGMLDAHNRRAVTSIEDRYAASCLRAAVVLYQQMQTWREKKFAAIAEIEKRRKANA